MCSEMFFSKTQDVKINKMKRKIEHFVFWKGCFYEYLSIETCFLILQECFYLNDNSIEFLRKFFFSLKNTSISTSLPVNTFQLNLAIFF